MKQVLSKINVEACRSFVTVMAEVTKGVVYRSRYAIKIVDLYKIVISILIFGFSVLLIYLTLF